MLCAQQVYGDLTITLSNRPTYKLGMSRKRGGDASERLEGSVDVGGRINQQLEMGIYGATRQEGFSGRNLFDGGSYWDVKQEKKEESNRNIAF